jgi:hypothetical protein
MEDSSRDAPSSTSVDNFTIHGNYQIYNHCFLNASNSCHGTHTGCCHFVKDLRNEEPPVMTFGIKIYNLLKTEDPHFNLAKKQFDHLSNVNNISVERLKADLQRKTENFEHHIQTATDDFERQKDQLETQIHNILGRGQAHESFVFPEHFSFENQRQINSQKSSSRIEKLRLLAQQGD